MPFRVTFTYQPAPAARPPDPRRAALVLRLQALADRATTRLRQLWQGVLTDLHSEGKGIGNREIGNREIGGGGNLSLPPYLPTSLPPSFPSPPLTEQGVTGIIAAALTQPAQRLLPVVLEEAVVRAGTQTLATLGVALPLQPGTAAVHQAIDAYVGTQIQAISETTREAIRAVLQTGWQTGQPLAEVTRAVQAVLGLTPRQAQTVARLQARLTAEGRTPLQIQRAVATASRVALRQRALQIARTEAQYASNLGSHLALLRSVDAGLLDAQAVRRVWTTAVDEALCPDCAPVPSMNPDGVGVQEPFHTPLGDTLFPPLHTNCRCVADTIFASQ